MVSSVEGVLTRQRELPESTKDDLKSGGVAPFTQIRTCVLEKLVGSFKDFRVHLQVFCFESTA